MRAPNSPDVDSLALIERLDQLVAEAKPVPLTREARIDRDEVYRVLDQLRTTLPVEFERARWIGREDDHEESYETQLRQIGAALAELRRAQRAQSEQPSRPPLTAAAADQVREIVEAAERTAAELEQDAAASAKRVREEADRQLQSARVESDRLLRESRERAAGEAAAYLSRVEEATKKMLERADAADSEINGMLARLRGSGGSVMEDLEAIMTGLHEIEVRRNAADSVRSEDREQDAEGNGTVAARAPAPAPAGAQPDASAGRSPGRRHVVIGGAGAQGRPGAPPRLAVAPGNEGPAESSPGPAQSPAPERARPPRPERRRQGETPGPPPPGDAA